MWIAVAIFAASLLLVSACFAIESILEFRERARTKSEAADEMHASER
jgi:hypothetical protein